MGLRLVDPGNLVTANSTTPLVVITQIQPITVVFTMAEDSLSELQAADAPRQAAAGRRLDRSEADQAGHGKLLEAIDNQIDTTTGTVKLRADLRQHRTTLLFPNPVREYPPAGEDPRQT